jgi:large subunit ribosomal protein L35
VNYKLTAVPWVLFCQEKMVMPKLKTHKATSKRFKKTGSGKLMRTHIGKSHLRRRTSKRVKRSLDKTEEVLSDGNLRRVHRLAPFIK